MLVHVVLFKFDQMEDAAIAREKLLGMAGRIPGLLSVEAGVDVTRSPRSFDLGLVTRHPDEEALRAYQVHPVHVEVAEFIRAKMTASAAVDFLANRG